MKTMNSKRHKRLVKEGTWIVVGQIVSIIGALVLVRVLTEYLEPAEYGEMMLGLTIAGLVNQVVMGGVINGIGRFYSIASEENDIPGYLVAARWLMGYAILAVIGITIVLSAGLMWFDYSQWIPLALIVLIFSILQNIGLSMRGIQNAARQRSIVALHMGMDSWLKTGLAVGVMFWLGSSSTAVIIGYTVSATLITASQFFFLRNFLRTKKDAHQENRSKDWRGQIWSFSKPFSIWGLFVWFQQVSDKWALGLFSTTGDIGQYAVLFQLGYVPIGIFTGMMISFLGPILYQRSGAATDDKRNKSVHKLVWYISGVGFLITGVAFIFTLTMNEWLFKFLVAEEFRISSPLLPWVVLAGGIFSVGQILALKLMSDMKVNLIKNVKIITAISGGVMNFYGAWYFGISGVVMALLAFSTFYFLWMAFIVYRASNFDIKIVDKL